MAITDSQKVDYLWKKVGYAATKTDTSSIKEGFNEAIPSPLQIRGDKVMTDSGIIPGTIPGANTSIVNVYTTSLPIECTNDATASTNRTWKTNVTDWIGPEFGSTYQVKVYVNLSNSAGNAASAGTQLFASGSGNNDEWFFDYQSGVLNFIGTNLPNGVSFTGKSVYVSGARYVGGFGVAPPGGNSIGNLTVSNVTISANSAAVSSSANIILASSGSGAFQFTGNAVGIPSGNTAQRPTVVSPGYIRFNTDVTDIEYWNGSTWYTPALGIAISDTITPDGASNVYTLSSNTSTLGVMVSINGTLQQPTTSYEIINNNQIRFSEIPLTSDIIEIRHIVSGTQTVSPDSLSFGTTLVELDIGNVNVTGNILPSANVTYDLGSPTLRWRTGYFSANTIDIGGGTIGLHDTLGFTFTTPGGSPQYMMPNGASTSNTFTSSTVTIQGNLAVNGNVTAIGNISGQYVLGSAQFLTGLPVQYSNVNTKAYTESMTFTNYSNVNVSAYLGGSFGIGTITEGSWQASPIGTAYGGTGATTTSGVGGALDNLLPSGEQTGYVLTTGGVGSYYWAAGGGGGGATVGQSLTTLRQSNAIISNTTVIGLAGISYTPGAGQLRVYINGVRQFPAAYTETSNVSYTLSANVVSGDTVFTEIDAFSSFNNYANLTYASNVGNIAAAGLTVQSAIESLENNKAPLTSPVFSGVTTIGGNLVVQGNLFVNGNLTTINANNLTINDSMIYLADDNPADTLDIGIVSAFTSPVRYQHTGFVRDATDGVWKLFANVVPEPTSTIDFTNANYSNLRLGNLTAIDGSFTGNITANVSGFSIGYRDLPQVAAGNVILALTDAGKHFYSSTNTPYTITIPSNANVSFTIGTTIVVINKSTANINISKQSEVSLFTAGNTTNTTRTLTSYGMATLVKTETNVWFLNGVGLV